MGRRGHKSVLLLLRDFVFERLFWRSRSCLEGDVGCRGGLIVREKEAVDPI